MSKPAKVRTYGLSVNYDIAKEHSMWRSGAYPGKSVLLRIKYRADLMSESLHVERLLEELDAF